jgi:fructokinase
MDQPQLFPLVRQKTSQRLNRYIQKPQLEEGLDQYIVPPGLGNRAGVLGAIALAHLAA